MTDRKDTNLETATAHEAWDAEWRSAAGREEWLTVEPDVAEVVPLLKERGVERTLDLGCGVGRHVRLFAAEGFSSHGLDGSEGGIAFTRDAAAGEGLTVDLRLGGMTALPYEDDFFDYVLSFNVIYHGDRTVVAKAISEIRRVLKPGGLFQGTMLSKRNGHYGWGREVAPSTFVEEGAVDDKNHPHFYCNAAELVALFDGFELMSLFDRAHKRPDHWHWHLLAEHRAIV